MNVFKAVIEVVTRLGRGTSQREIKRAEAAAPAEGTADGEAVDGNDHDRRGRSPVRIPPRERRRMADRLQGCEKREAVLVADLDGQDAALSEVLSDWNAGREPDSLAVADTAPLAVRRADAAA